MPKVLVLEPVVVNYHDDRGGIAEEAGTLINVDAAQAQSLARFGRVLFVNKGDDPTKGQQTAPESVVALAEAHAGQTASDDAPATGNAPATEKPVA